jgi:hypothetical protein
MLRVTEPARVGEVGAHDHDLAQALTANMVLMSHMGDRYA